MGISLIEIFEKLDLENWEGCPTFAYMSINTLSKQIEDAKENSLHISNPIKYSQLHLELQTELLKSILEHFQTNTAPNTYSSSSTLGQEKVAKIAPSDPTGYNGILEDRNYGK